MSYKKSTFLQDLVKKLQACQDHLHNCNAQFKAFKEAREEAINNSAVATIQIDWSKMMQKCQNDADKRRKEDIL